MIYLIYTFREENSTTKLKYTFTPMHGVGQRFAELAFEAFNLPPFVSVREQVILYFMKDRIMKFYLTRALPSLSVILHNINDMSIKIYHWQ